MEIAGGLEKFLIGKEGVGEPVVTQAQNVLVAQGL
jgi:hypothetical protein